MKDKLLAKFQDRSAVIGIVGQGYVGLPLGLVFMDAGLKVIGFDIDQGKVDSLLRGRSYIAHISSARIKERVDSGLFQPTTDFSRVPEADAIIICVPTPLNVYREPDLSYVIGTVETIQPYLRAGQVLSLESTTYPGTTDEEILPRVEARGFKAGRDIFVVYSPEREDPANPDFNTRTIPKVCGGVTPACAEVGRAMYELAVEKVVMVSSTKVAELTKLLENIYRAVNIGLVNELKTVADKMGIDIHEVIGAAATKPFGFTPFYPGPGLGGHCIPIDPFYLTWKSRAYGVHTRFIELAGEINRQMPSYVISKVTLGLNQAGRSVKGSRVLVLGLAYKKNVDDMRESPSIEIMELLTGLGAQVDYSDPHIPEFPETRRGRLNHSSVALTPDSVAGYDCVVLVTDHDSFDYDMIAANARVLVDSRGKFKNDPQVIKA